MKYFLLILSLLLVIGTLNPKALKINTIKKVIDSLLDQYKQDVAKTKYAMALGQGIAIVYCLMLAVFINSFTFTVVMALWIAQSIFDQNMFIRYLDSKDIRKVRSDFYNKSIKEEKPIQKAEDKLLNSRLYRLLSKIIDCGVYGYIIYFIMVNW